MLLHFKLLFRRAFEFVFFLFPERVIFSMIHQFLMNMKPVRSEHINYAGVTVILKWIVNMGYLLGFIRRILGFRLSVKAVSGTRA